MTETLKPDDAVQALEIIRWAVAEEVPLALTGAGSKATLGRPSTTSHVLDLSRLTGVGLYEPEELVLTAEPATPLSEIEGLLRQNRQQLAFEPADYGALLGGASGQQTLGGVIACNLAGPRRIQAGAARDHFLGVQGISGRGENFKSGGRVVKNVTGYDLCKLMAGSHGTLAAFTQLTVKVLPAPEKTRTVLVYGLDDAAAIEALAQAAGSPHEVTGLAHLPAAAAARSTVSYINGAGAAVTTVRVEGPAPSVEHRGQSLREELSRFGPVEELHGMNSGLLWQEVRDVEALLPTDGHQIWKLSVTPSQAPGVAARALRGTPGEALFDWAGGLVWLSLPESDDARHETVRAAVGLHGHATLLRADAVVRGRVPVFQPQPPALARLSARVKESFDPRHILNPGRMYAEF